MPNLSGSASFTLRRSTLLLVFPAVKIVFSLSSFHAFLREFLILARLVYGRVFDERKSGDNFA